MQATQAFPTELLLKAQNVRVVFLDVDGVFTDFADTGVAARTAAEAMLP